MSPFFSALLSSGQLPVCRDAGVGASPARAARFEAETLRPSGIIRNRCGAIRSIVPRAPKACRAAVDYSLSVGGVGCQDDENAVTVDELFGRLMHESELVAVEDRDLRFERFAVIGGEHSSHVGTLSLLEQ